MAFGDLKDTGTGSSTSTTTSNTAEGIGATANVGDLIYALFVEATNRTVSTVNDNLGNTYTAVNAGTDAGAVTARSFYTRVTVPGTIIAVEFVGTASADDWCGMFALFEGPFSSIDSNPANVTSDVTSPFSCPATGALGQADELVVASGAANYATTWLATSPMVKRVELAFSTTIKGVIASKVVAAATTTTPEFTAAGNPTQAILGTTTFRKIVTETVSVTKATVTVTGKTVTVLSPVTETVTVTQASVTLTGKTVTVRELELIPVAQASASVAGKTVTIVDITVEVVPVNAAAILFTGQTVALVDTTPSSSVVAVDKADIDLIGKTVTPTDTVAPIAPAALVFTGKTVTSADTSTVVVANAAVAFAGKTIAIRDADVVAVDRALLALTGKPFSIVSAMPVTKATVTFTGKTVTVVTSTFEDVPKYIIRGRGSRHGLWTQGFGGTIKGRGSRAFLVMR